METLKLGIFLFHKFIIPDGSIETQPPKNDSKLQTFVAIQDLDFVKHLLSFHLKILVGEGEDSGGKEGFWKLFSPKLITLKGLALLYILCAFGVRFTSGSRFYFFFHSDVSNTSMELY